MHRTFKFHFAGIAAFLAAIAVFSVAAMFLWNAIMPEIFGLHVLNYWQTAGLLLLARILFGGLGLRDFWPHGRRGGFHSGNPLREKWMNMTDDERKEFLRSHQRFSHFHEFFDERLGESGKDAPSNAGDKHE